MSNKRKRTLIRKHKSGKVTRLPARQARLSIQDREQKLSELIKDMAWSLLKDPGAIPSPPAAQAALTLATVAWNSAVGDTVLPDDYGKVIEQINRRGTTFWAELRPKTRTNSLPNSSGRSESVIPMTFAESSGPK